MWKKVVVVDHSRYDAGKVAQCAVSADVVEGQVDAAFLKGQSTLAFAVTEFAVALRWVYRWRAVQHKLQHKVRAQCFYMWLFKARNTCAFDWTCVEKQIYGLESFWENICLY